MSMQGVFAAAALCLVASAANAADRDGSADAGDSFPTPEKKDNGEFLTGWRLPQGASIDDGTLTVAIPEGEVGRYGMAKREIDLRPYAGKSLLAEIDVEGKNVSKPPQNWNGVKFMLFYVDGDGEKHWPQANSETGTFARETRRFMVDFPDGAPEKGVLSLGLEKSSGEVKFDLASLRLKPLPNMRNMNRGYKVAYPERIEKLGQLRGVMLPANKCREEDFKTLRQWGATLARYQMIRGWGKFNDNQDLDEFGRWLDGKLDHLEEVLAWARVNGIKIVVDLHVPPGGRRDSTGEMNMFHDKKFADAFVDCWKKIARRFKGRKEIYGFDLINEPQQRIPGECGYWDLQRRAAEAVRAIDTDTPIIIESNGWDSPSAFGSLPALAMDNVIYQVHMYQPFDFTHQGVHGKAKGVAYPDETKGWNRECLKKHLQPVRAFQKEHGCRIYVGEFSAAAWAPGADRYLSDCIGIFKEYGWDWTYHAFREWTGWSVEHEGEDGARMRPSAGNPRKTALLDGLRGK